MSVFISFIAWSILLIVFSRGDKDELPPRDLETEMFLQEADQD